MAAERGDCEGLCNSEFGEIQLVVQQLSWHRDHRLAKCFELLVAVFEEHRQRDGMVIDMTDEKFDQLVNRIQRRYGSRPLWLRLRIAWLVLLGYAGFLTGLLVVLAVSLGLAISAVVAGTTPSVVLLGIMALVLTFGIVQACVFLWVPMTTLQAREVNEDEVPKLFRVLDMLEAEFETEPFDTVQVTPYLNASVQLVPRWGVFGGCRRHLYLGLPLMHMLTPEQFAVVLAHEFAHASSRHDRFGNWIYRLRVTWSRIFAELHSPQGGVVNTLRGGVTWFIDWYWPRFNAYAFVLSRANEYQADRISANWGGVPTVAQALWRVECFSLSMADGFSEMISRQARLTEEVPDDFISRVRTYFAKDPSEHDANRWMEKAINAVTGSADTHPSLSDRLGALGEDGRRMMQAGFPKPPKESAAEILLEGSRRQITSDINKIWQDENRLHWTNAFDQAKRLEKKLSSKETASSSDSVSAEQQWERARTVGQLQGHAAAEPLLRLLVSEHPNHAQGNVALGAALLERGYGEGEQYLRRVLLAGESDMIPMAGDILVNYLQQSGKTEVIKEVRQMVTRYQETSIAAAKERSAVSSSDTLVPHELSRKELEGLFKTLDSQSDLDRAWLVRKELKHFPNQKLFVLVVRSTVQGWFRQSDPKLDRTLVTSLMGAVVLPGRVLVISPQAGFAALARKVMSIQGAEVFSRG